MGKHGHEGHEWPAQARHIEDLGYATLLVPDHFVTDFPPLTALMSAADATTTLRVGSLVFDNDFWHPIQLAREVATIDLLSGGRFELGLGAGWHRDEYAGAGIPFASAGVRVERLAEAVAIFKQFFTAEAVTYTGAHYQIKDLPAIPKPVQQPHPPISIGGGGKRLLTLAGSSADIVGLHYKVNPDMSVDAIERTTAGLARKVAWVQAAAGDRFPQIELSLLLSDIVIADDRTQAAEEMIKKHAITDRSAEDLLEDPYWLIGSVAAISEQIQRLREHFGIAYCIVRSDGIEPFAAIVQQLAGR